MAKRAYIGIDGKARKIKKGYIGIENRFDIVGGSFYYDAGDSIWYLDETVSLPSSWDNPTNGDTQNVTVEVNGVLYDASFTWSGYDVMWTWSSTSQGSPVSELHIVDDPFLGLYVEGFGSDTSKTYNVRIYIREDVSSARKIKKAYIGIGGVARPCWGGDPIDYYGTITPLDFLGGGDTFVGVSAGDYAVFAGGNSVASHHYYVNAYDANLTRTIAPNLNNEREDFAGAYISTDKYTLFAGGTDDDGTVIAAVDAYDASLTHISASDMKVPREQMASASVGKYAIFAGGLDADGSRSGDVEYFYRGTSQISRNTVNSAYDLQIKSKDIVGGTNGTLAIFYTWYSSTDRIDAYNSSLTYSKVADVGVTRDNRSIARAGDYAIVAGGLANNLPCSDMNIALNQSLTITPVDDIQEARYFIKSTSLGQYAVFAGGHLTNGASGSSKVDLYDASLTHTIATDISVGVHDHAVASVGNYALIAGGNRNGNNYAYSDIVEAFTLSE